MENCCNFAQIIGESNSGGMIGYLPQNARATILNCKNEGQISGKSNAAGMIGNFFSKTIIEKCINNGNINSSNGNAGGIVGWMRGANSTKENLGMINKCFNNGQITGYQSAGGIVGNGNFDTTIRNSYNNYKGLINSSDGYAGGIAGINAMKGEGGIFNCYNLGIVSGNYSGGIMGQYGWPYGGEAANCISDYNIEGKTASGGIVR